MNLLLAVVLALAAPHESVSDSIRRSIEKDRSDTEAWLKSGETSYIATVARTDFGSRTTLRVGRAPDNEVRLDADSIAAHHLEVTVVGDSFQVVARDPGAAFIAGKATVRLAVLGPSSIRVGHYT